LKIGTDRQYFKTEEEEEKKKEEFKLAWEETQHLYNSKLQFIF